MLMSSLISKRLAAALDALVAKAKISSEQKKVESFEAELKLIQEGGLGLSRDLHDRKVATVYF